MLFVTEREVEDWARAGLRVVEVDGEVTLTPLAAEAAVRLGLEITTRRNPAMPAGTRTVRQRLLNGKQLTGTFIQIPHPVVTEFAGRLGFDLLCLDAEHSAMPGDTIESLIRAADAVSMPSLVRVAGNDPTIIATALDAGAAGVIVPRVNTGPETMRAVSASRYPPQGERGLGPGRAAGYGRDVSACRIDANEHLLVAVQIETQTAVQNLDEIISTPGLDLAFVGPYDLAASLGQEPGSPAMDRVVQDVLAQCREAGLLTGVFTARPEAAQRWFANGVNLVLISSDLGWLEQGAATGLAKLGTNAGSTGGYGG